MDKKERIRKKGLFGYYLKLTNMQGEEVIINYDCIAAIEKRQLGESNTRIYAGGSFFEVREDYNEITSKIQKHYLDK